MKKIFILMIIAGLAFSFTTIYKPVTETFKVYGNCGQCKARIESALDTKGVKAAEWNIDTKMLQVVYMPDKITIEQIHQLIAGVGHDTDKAKAPDSVYLQLPDCCLFRDHPNTHHD